MNIETIQATKSIQDSEKTNIDPSEKNIARNINSQFTTKKNTDQILTEKQDKEKITAAIKATESYLQNNGTKLKFVMTDKQKMQVEIREENTHKLIRKIPTDEMLNLAEAIEKMTGVFLNNRI